jgi:hypothetical protein
VTFAELKRHAMAELHHERRHERDPVLSLVGDQDAQWLHQV